MKKVNIDDEYLGIVLEMARNEGAWALYIETSPANMNVKLARGAISRILRMENMNTTQKQRPMSEALRDGTSIRAWNPNVPCWSDIKWEDDGWILSEDSGFSLAKPVYPTCWRDEPPPHTETKL